MPPANSPNETPGIVTHFAGTTSDLGQQLRAISSPVTDFAATLRPHAPSRNDRSRTMTNPRPITSAHGISPRNQRQQYATEDEFQQPGRWTENYTMDQGTNDRGMTMQSYSNRTPVRQSIYAWAAASGGDSESEDDYEITGPPRFQLVQENEHEQDTASLLRESRRWRSQLRRELEPRDEPSGRVTLPSIQHIRRNAQEPSDEAGAVGSAEVLSSGRSPSVTAALSRLIERQRLERRERDLERQRRPDSTLWLSERMLERRNQENLSEVQTDVLRRVQGGYEAGMEASSSSTTALEAARERADRREAQLRALRQQDERTLHSLRATRERNQRLEKQRQLYPPMPKTVNVIKYLSGLRRSNDISGALDYAAELGLPTLYSPSSTTSPSDLLLSTRGLTPTQQCAFLSPGTTFRGTQTSPLDLPASTLNRDRDYLRRMVANRNLNRSSTNLPDSMSALMDAERYVADLLEDHGDSNSANRSNNLYSPPMWLGERGSRHQHSHRQLQPSLPQARAIDSWPVRVTFHTVSLQPDQMHVSGTMFASHIPDKLLPTSSDHRPEGSSMESFFEGEIIDCRKWSLETEEDEISNPESDHYRPRESYTYNPGYRSSGVTVDARYWRGVGPFRAITAEVKKKKLEMAIAQEMSKAAEEEKPSWTEEQVEELEAETDEEIAKCLGNRAWIERMIGGRGEWILMRWKERCFTSPMPSCTAPSTSEALRNMQNHTHAPPRFAASSAVVDVHATPVNPDASVTPTDATATGPRQTSSLPGCYGLTINGYYYIALHRQTGKIEGLYFDSGSTPFQELRLYPEGTSIEEIEAVGDVGMVKSVGLKKWFPSVEGR